VGYKQVSYQQACDELLGILLALIE
jgi:hypothetical protein